MTDKVKYVPEEKRRFTEAKQLKNGRFETEWRLTDRSLTGLVEIAIPPKNSIPIVFVPGIMGSNLRDLDGNPVWLLDAFGSAPAELAMAWATKKAGFRQQKLHPDRTKVYELGAVPAGKDQDSGGQERYRKLGWGEVSEASYHKFLLWLDNKLNRDRNPLAWSDFTHESLSGSSTVLNSLTRKLKPGLLMKMPGLPIAAEPGYKVELIKSDELLKRSKSKFPIYAFGYNWLASNNIAAEELKGRIEKIIDENNCGESRCTQVIVVTHSMGGLVARACSQLNGMSRKILGIVHGVMPATGAAVAYRRCKVGMKDEDRVAGLVIGSDGREVTAVFAQAPGALQLLPSFDYGTKWMEIVDQNGRQISALPLTDPYEEIYLEKDKWWGLVKNEWLSPPDGKPIRWANYVKNVQLARDFHRSIEKRYHHNTFVFYGGGAEKGSFLKIRWNVRKGVAPSTKFSNPANNVREIVKLDYPKLRTDGSNYMFVGGETVQKTVTRGDSVSVSTVETSFWELRCALQDSSGDGTVPASSGSAPRQGGGNSILQQFEVDGIAHEPAFRDYAAPQLITLYAITKLAAKADVP